MVLCDWPAPYTPEQLDEFLAAMDRPSYILEAKASEETMKVKFREVNEKEYNKEEDEEALKEMMDY